MQLAQRRCGASGAISSGSSRPRVARSSLREPQSAGPAGAAGPAVGRRDLAALAAAALAALAQLSAAREARAITGNPLAFKKELNRKRRKVPESEFKDGPEGLKFYDLEVGGGAEARAGQRVAVHVDVKWRGVTFMTSRQGMGVTGGTPIGFDVGQPPGSPGSTMAGIDLGVRGMRVGGQRRLLVPPGLGYGKKGYGEIPPDATLQVDVELLSIKTSPLGYRTKLVEG